MLVYQEGSLKLCGQDTLVPSICQATFGKGAPIQWLGLDPTKE